MENNNKVVLGIFTGRDQVERAVDDLRSAGFRHADISVLMPESESTKEFAHVNATKLPEGAATGGTAGAVLGGTLGLLAGIGTLAIPGIGPFIAAGPIMATLAGIGAGSAVGGIAGALIGWGIPEYEARRYEGLVREGGYLLSVHCDNSDWVDKAKDILRRNNASDISSQSESNADSPDSVTKDKPRPMGSNQTDYQTTRRTGTL